MPSYSLSSRQRVSLLQKKFDFIYYILKMNSWICYPVSFPRTRYHSITDIKNEKQILLQVPAIPIWTTIAVSLLLKLLDNSCFAAFPEKARYQVLLQVFLKQLLSNLEKEGDQTNYPLGLGLGLTTSGSAKKVTLTCQYAPGVYPSISSICVHY